MGTLTQNQSQCSGNSNVFQYALFPNTVSMLSLISMAAYLVLENSSYRLFLEVFSEKVALK